MKKLLPALLTLVLCTACEQKIETPAGGDKETTIVNPPASGEKSETNTTVVTPPAAEKKTETNTTVVNPPAAETKTDSTSTTTTTQ